MHRPRSLSASASAPPRPSTVQRRSSFRRFHSNIEPSDVVSTILVNNIHCASCVSYVQDILSRLDHDIHRIDVNIVTHQVIVHHSRHLRALEICQILSDHAFEVHSVSTKDGDGDAIWEYDLPQQKNQAWLEEATGAWKFAAKPELCLATSGHAEKKRRHIDNCEACQREERNASSEKNCHPSVTPPVAGASSSLPQGIKSSHLVSVLMRDTPESVAIADANPLAVSAPSNLDGEKGSAFLKTEPLQGNIKGHHVVYVDNRTSDKALPGNEETCNASLSIGGMTCASCSNVITKGLEGMDFVISAKVSLLTNSATVTFQGPPSRVNEIVEEIEDLGYEVSVEECGKSLVPPTQSFGITLSVGGMTCASCVNSVTKGLQNLPFVRKAEVSLVSNSAYVECEGKDVGEKLKEEVEDLGFDCDVVSIKELGADVSHESVKERKIRLKIDGMFCGHCPAKVAEAIESVLPENAYVDQVPTLQNPIITIVYTPNSPSLTIRTFLKAINDKNEAFVSSVYIPPSIEERSRRMQKREQFRLSLRLILSFIVAIPTFLIGIVWMTLVSEHNRIRMFFMKPLWAGRVSRVEWALFILATPVMFFAADVFHVRAIKEIRSLWRRGSQVPILRRFYRFGSMNLLISAGTSVAYFSSLALLIWEATTSGKPSSKVTTYFDSVVFLTFFILIGRYLEAYSKARTGDAVSMLGTLRPTEAYLVPTLPEPQEQQGKQKSSSTATPSNDIHGQMHAISVDLLEVGDVVNIPHGSSPPADGIIVGNDDVQYRLDESSLTGESRPVVKQAGDKIFSGSINIGRSINMQVTDVGGTSMLDQIVSIVREGQTRSAPVERIADTLTGYFVPVITAIAILTFIIWVALGESGSLPASWLDVDEGGWPFWSLRFAIATFVVACPCGIGLAAPTALFVGSGLAAKHGILVRGGGEAFQEASNIDVVVFDKTGTLTEGKSPKVADHEVLVDGDEAKVAWTLAQCLEQESGHPIAKAIVGFCSSRPKFHVNSADIQETAGNGLRGTFELDINGSKQEYEAVIGSEHFISSLGVQVSDYFNVGRLTAWKTEGKSVAIMAMKMSTSSPNWILAAIFSTADPIRQESSFVVNKIRERGIDVYMLTGDNPTTASAVGQALGIPATNVIAGVLPTEKADRIRWLQENAFGIRSKKHRRAIVAFVGDGINDAPALSTADVSIAIGSGSDVALTSSSFILLTSNLTTLLSLLSLSTAVFRRIKFNFGWALVYNVCLVPIAAGVIYPVKGHPMLDPVWASAAMAASSLSVVCSSLVLRSKIPWFGFRATKC